MRSMTSACFGADSNFALVLSWSTTRSMASAGCTSGKKFFGPKIEVVVAIGFIAGNVTGGSQRAREPPLE